MHRNHRVRALAPSRYPARSGALTRALGRGCALACALLLMGMWALAAQAPSAWAQPLTAASHLQAGMPAHATMVSTSPSDGSTVPSPGTLSVTFDEAPTQDFAQLTLTGPSGGVVVVSTPKVDGPVVRADLPQPLAPGRYTMGWRVVSDDGHPVSGSASFTVAAGTSAASSASSVPPGAVGTASATSGPSTKASGSGATNASTSTSAPALVGGNGTASDWLIPLVGGMACVVVLAGGLVWASRREPPR